MIDKPPEVIYLIPYDNGYVWCEDPAPGIDMDEADAVSYVRVDTLVEQACEAIDGLDGDDRVIFKVEAQEAIMDKFK